MLAILLYNNIENAGFNTGNLFNPTVMFFLLIIKW